MPTALEAERMLRRHVLDVWYPRCVDHQDGGFFCDYDREWTFCGPHEKMLEFQARQTLMAADACRAYPSEQKFRDATAHGFKYLREVLWDAEYGGWYHRVTRDGKPLEHHTKHMHGFAYAIEACAAVHQALGTAESLQLARESLEWMDQFARDREHGGYFGFLLRDGTVVKERGQAPWKTTCDVLATPIGLKDLNVHSDMLETFVQLHQVMPGPLIAERLAESIDIITRRMFSPATGAMMFFMTPDWQPVPHLVRAGYQMQSAFRLTTAAPLAAEPALVRRVSIALADLGIRQLYDRRHAGFVYAAASCEPNELFDQHVGISYKSWWVQIEALRTLLAMTVLEPENPRWQRAFEEQWRYLSRNFIDEAHGGFYTGGLDMMSRIRRKIGARVAPAKITRKGDEWKDASHEGRALLYVMERLRAREGATR